MPPNSYYNQTRGGRILGDGSSPDLTEVLMEEGNTYGLFLPSRCCPGLIHAVAVAPLHSWIHFVWLFRILSHYRLEGGRNLYGSSWRLQIGPSAVTIYFIWIDRRWDYRICPSFVVQQCYCKKTHYQFLICFLLCRQWFCSFLFCPQILLLLKGSALTS